MGRGSQGQQGQQGQQQGQQMGGYGGSSGSNAMQNMRGGMGHSRLPNMQGSPFPGRGPMATMPGADGGVSSAPWGDIDWMKLRDQFAQGQQGGGGSGGWMEALKNRAPQGRGAPHANGMTQAMSQARAYSPSGGGSQEGFRPQGINPITTAGSVAGTQQSPTASIETGVTPQSAVAGAQPAPSGPPPAQPTGLAPAPAQPGGAGGANAQALIQALRARGGR
jgi:hypothetical protein